jgi:hypothetical protein
VRVRATWPRTPRQDAASTEDLARAARPGR